ncbi:uncharacterized protein RCC_00180 [Ramularia collo-cygni]|uniref:Uncharacterized protein n=1 Tax=Ramularia collo-cygni TaxID=112498 RepID=A0A2D3UTS5_9PEZI|nr:uncharacterized protein RCC_00180 [Ramularia collo-cygni]CZT14206.1 uncharacterized protein RCC_00180 [Ramularia collo-cygni]
MSDWSVARRSSISLPAATVISRPAQKACVDKSCLPRKCFLDTTI